MLLITVTLFVPEACSQANKLNQYDEMFEQQGVIKFITPNYKGVFEKVGDDFKLTVLFKGESLEEKVLYKVVHNEKDMVILDNEHQEFHLQFERGKLVNVIQVMYEQTYVKDGKEILLPYKELYYNQNKIKVHNLEPVKGPNQ
jgi:hypothetical protein